MTYFVLASGISLAILAVLLWSAPRGWQDQAGFHLGEEPYQRIEEPAVKLESQRQAQRKAAGQREAA